MATNTCTQRVRYKGSLRVISFGVCAWGLSSTAESLVAILGPWLKCAHQPRDNHLLEYGRVRPHLYLSSKMTALRIDPSRLGNITFTEQQINIGDRDLSIQNSSHHQHRRHRFSQKA